MMIQPEKTAKVIATRIINGHVIAVNYWEKLGVNGMFAVITTEPDGKTGTSKIFKTETAWSDAERYANDELLRIGGDYTQHITL